MWFGSWDPLKMRFNHGFCLNNFFLLLMVLVCFCTVESETPLFQMVRVWSQNKCIELGLIQLKKLIFIFFNCVLFKKIRRKLLNDVAFAKFDYNLNFVLDDILPDIVALLRNHEKCSSCWIDFVRYEIAHSLMEQ